MRPAADSFAQRWAARIDGALNPLMVKEAHQSFRNRTLLLMGFFALGAPLLIFMGTIASSAVSDAYSAYDPSERAGDTFFKTLSGCAMLVTWVAVPARAAAMFYGEIRSRTIDLTLLTSLTPWQLASGRFQAAALQIVLLLGFLLPFAVASIALGGVGADRVLSQLLLIFVIALMQCSAALLTITASALAPRLLALFALIGIGELFMAFSFGMAFSANAFSSIEPWLLVAMGAEAALAGLFFLRLSADMLAPPGMRSYVRSKLMMVALLALFFAIPFVSWLFGVHSGDEEGFMFMGAFWLCAFGLFWCGADRRPGSAGPLGYVFEDGIESGTLYVGLLLGLMAIGGVLAHWEPWIPFAFLVYFVFMVGAGALLQSLFFTRNAEGFFVGVLVFAVIDMVLTFVTLAQGGWNVGDKPPLLAVLLPAVWLSDEDRVAHAMVALPFALGVVMLIAARVLRRKKHG